MPERTTAAPRLRPRAITHYCDYDAPGRFTVRALCGIYIRRQAHANAPTCPDCARALEARKDDDA